MINRTIAARDNVTLTAEGDCMNYLEVVADLANAQLEERRDEFAKVYEDMCIYGTAGMFFP